MLISDNFTAKDAVEGGCKEEERKQLVEGNGDVYKEGVN